MQQFRDFTGTIHRSEEGHAVPALASLLGAIGAILLGIGAANDSGVLAVVGGILAAVGILAGPVLEHVVVDYNIFDRLEKLEKK
ncbi:MAG: hypothetical protein AB7J35_19105 [Dehalococcoidia bacterium]